MSAAAAKDLHRAAMVMADLAIEAERRAVEFYREAADFERRAVDEASGLDREVLVKSLENLNNSARRLISEA